MIGDDDILVGDVIAILTVRRGGRRGVGPEMVDLGVESVDDGFLALQQLLQLGDPAGQALQIAVALALAHADAAVGDVSREATLIVLKPHGTSTNDCNFQSSR